MDAVTPVKVILAVLYSPTAPLEEVLRLLEGRFSNIDFRSACHPFVETNYYEAEMGQGLQRFLLSFATPLPPDFLAQAKVDCRALEEQYAQNGQRRINLDVGYLDHHKVVLASFKHRGNKIYLSQGVYADWSLTYEKGKFLPQPWCFADFASGQYDADLLKIRDFYKKSLKA